MYALYAFAPPPGGGVVRAEFDPVLRNAILIALRRQIRRRGGVVRAEFDPGLRNATLVAL